MRPFIAFILVFFNLPLAEDIYIEVKNAEGMIGTLTISKAFIEWKPKNKRYGNRKMRWKMFDKVMEAYSTKNKKTTF